MKVLLSSCTHWWNAEAAYAAALAETLLNAGHEVRIWSAAGSANEAALKARGLPLLLPSLPIPGQNPFRLKATLTGLAQVQRSEHFDLVDVFRSAEFPLHLWLAKKRAGPPVVRTRGSAQKVRGGWLNRRMYGRWSAGLIASSDVVRTQLCAALGLAKAQVRTIYYPAAAPAHLPPPSQAARERFLHGLGFSPDVFLLGVVGRLYPEKGHTRLLEALPILLREVPRARLVIFAKDAPGEDPERDALKAQVRREGLVARVRFEGYQPQMSERMALLDVGVIPSLVSEVNCRVAMEFFAAGTPVVAFPTGALPEVVEHTVSGLITQDHSAVALGAALIQLAKDEALRKRLGRTAQRRAETRFSAQRFLKKTLAVFEAALEKP